MGDFAKCVEIVIGYEGGDRISNEAEDAGGLTKFGITQTVYAEAHPGGSVKDCTRVAAEAIYRTRYWDPIHGDVLPAALALCLFQFAVNAGPVTAIRKLQQVVGAKQDGIVGTDTLTGARNLGPEACVRLLRAQIGYYDDIVRGHPPQVKFVSGWQSRVIRTAMDAGRLGVA